jgi:hypothetical protein
VLLEHRSGYPNSLSPFGKRARDKEKGVKRKENG